MNTFFNELQEKLSKGINKRVNRNKLKKIEIKIYIRHWFEMNATFSVCFDIPNLTLLP